RGATTCSRSRCDDVRLRGGPDVVPGSVRLLGGTGWTALPALPRAPARVAATPDRRHPAGVLGLGRRERLITKGRGRMPALWFTRSRAAFVMAAMVLSGCASLAVTPCDTVEDRDGKYFGRFFLGVATLGLSEVTIQQEEVRQAYQGSPSCPPPAGMRVVTGSTPKPAGGQTGGPATLAHRKPWARVSLPGQDPPTPRPR